MVHFIHSLKNMEVKPPSKPESDVNKTIYPFIIPKSDKYMPYAWNLPSGSGSSASLGYASDAGARYLGYNSIEKYAIAQGSRSMEVQSVPSTTSYMMNSVENSSLSHSSASMYDFYLAADGRSIEISNSEMLSSVSSSSTDYTLATESNESSLASTSSDASTLVVANTMSDKYAPSLQYSVSSSDSYQYDAQTEGQAENHDSNCELLDCGDTLGWMLDENHGSSTMIQGASNLDSSMRGGRELNSFSSDESTYIFIDDSFASFNSMQSIALDESKEDGEELENQVNDDYQRVVSADFDDDDKSVLTVDLPRSLPQDSVQDHSITQSQDHESTFQDLKSSEPKLPSFFTKLNVFFLDTTFMVSLCGKKELPTCTRNKSSIRIPASTANLSSARKFKQFYKAEKSYRSNNRVITNLYSAIHSKNSEIALKRMREHPEEVRIWVSCCDSILNDGGIVRPVTVQYLPLHAACQSPAPKDVVEELLSIYPGAIRSRAGNSKYAIHLACEATAEPAVISLLIEKWPASIYALDGDNNIPLTNLIRSKPLSPRQSEIMRLLLAAFASHDEQGV